LYIPSKNMIQKFELFNNIVIIIIIITVINKMACLMLIDFISFLKNNTKCKFSESSYFHTFLI